MITDQKLEAIFEEVAQHVRSSVTQPRASIIRDSRRRLSYDAQDVAAVHVIAAANLQDHKPDRSLTLLHSRSDALTGNATGHRIAGYAHLALHEMNEAMAQFDQAVRIDPCQCDSWTMLGSIEESSGHRDAAITYYQRALVFNDRNHESALALSRIYSAQRKIKDAIDTLRVSLFRDRRNAKLNLALARLLEKRGALLRRSRRWRAEARVLKESADCYRIVVSASPTPEVCVALGLLLRQLGRHEESKRAFEKAVLLDGESAVALTHLANARVDSGEIEQAIEGYRESLAIEPERAMTHFRYSRARRFKPTPESDRYIEDLSVLLQAEDRPVRERIHLNFALAKVLDDRGDYSRAWQHYDTANRLKPTHREHDRRDESPLQRVADDAIRVFSHEFFDRHRGMGNPSRVPIFIVGMPRSGTTLTEQILSSHRQISGAGELKQIDRIRHRLMRENRRLSTSNSGNGFASQSTFETMYPDLLETIQGDRIAMIAEQHLATLEEFRETADHVTDKMPTNFMHLGLIALMFPRATVIHCRRNPMDVLVSAYCQNLSAPFCNLEALVAYHRQYRRMMAHWNQVLPLTIHSVDYESLVSDPEPNARAMINHCGLPWQSGCLEFHSNERAVHTPSKWQVRQPMYNTSVEKWKRFADQLAPIASRIEAEIASESSQSIPAV